MSKRKPQPIMKFEKSKTGYGVIRINTGAYLNFGDSNPVRYINVKIDNESRMFPVAMKRLPAPYTKEIGTKNIKRIRELVIERLVDGSISQNQVMEIGEIINSERKC